MRALDVSAGDQYIFSGCDASDMEAVAGDVGNIVPSGDQSGVVPSASRCGGAFGFAGSAMKMTLERGRLRLRIR